MCLCLAVLIFLFGSVNSSAHFVSRDGNKTCKKFQKGWTCADIFALKMDILMSSLKIKKSLIGLKGRWNYDKHYWFYEQMSKENFMRYGKFWGKIFW